MVSIQEGGGVTVNDPLAALSGTVKTNAAISTAIEMVNCRTRRASFTRCGVRCFCVPIHPTIFIAAILYSGSGSAHASIDERAHLVGECGAVREQIPHQPGRR